MTDIPPFNIKLWLEKTLFQEINAQIDLFTKLFTEISNQIDLNGLVAIHPNSKGVKISKGNKLENCPYQVLDIIRDFDPDTGMNIRVLNWWGHGLFLLIWYAPATAYKFEKAIQDQLRSFTLSKTISSWDYPALINTRTKREKIDLKKHFLEYSHFQIFKKIELETDYHKSLLTILSEIEIILDNHS